MPNDQDLFSRTHVIRVAVILDQDWRSRLTETKPVGAPDDFRRSQGTLKPNFPSIGSDKTASGLVDDRRCQTVFLCKPIKRFTDL